MKLYTDRGGRAPSPRRVRFYLAEKGIDVPTEELELHVENRTAEFRKKNALGNLPVLELDDGTCIAESMAICRYFEVLHPDPPLFGATPLELATIEMWTRRVELYFYTFVDVAQTFDENAPAAAKQFRDWGTLALAFLDRELGQREFVAGERFSMADIFAYGAVDFCARYASFPVPDERAHVLRWFDMIGARPAARA